MAADHVPMVQTLCKHGRHKRVCRWAGIAGMVESTMALCRSREYLVQKCAFDMPSACLMLCHERQVCDFHSGHLK